MPGDIRVDRGDAFDAVLSLFGLAREAFDRDGNWQVADRACRAALALLGPVEAAYRTPSTTSIRCRLVRLMSDAMLAAEAFHAAKDAAATTSTFNPE